MARASIFLAREANLSVLCVSSACVEAGVMVQMTAMRAPVPANMGGGGAAMVGAIRVAARIAGQ